MSQNSTESRLLYNSARPWWYALLLACCPCGFGHGHPFSALYKSLSWSSAVLYVDDTPRWIPRTRGRLTDEVAEGRGLNLACTLQRFNGGRDYRLTTNESTGNGCRSAKYATGESSVGRGYELDNIHGTGTSRIRGRVRSGWFAVCVSASISRVHAAQTGHTDGTAMYRSSCRCYCALQSVRHISIHEGTLQCCLLCNSTSGA